MLREVWLNIGVEKIDTHEGVMIKALLDSGADGDLRELDLETRVTTNGRSKPPRCFTVVH